MEKIRHDQEIVSIEDAINITSGTLKYQKILVLIQLIGIIGTVPIMMCLQSAILLIAENCTSVEACDEYDTLGPIKKNNAASDIFQVSFHIGNIIGLFGLSLLADRYGRKTIIMISCITGGCVLTTTAFSINTVMLCIGMFSFGVLYPGIFSISFILSMETINYKYRNRFLGLFFISSSLSTALFSILYRDITWRYLVIVSAASLLIQASLMRYTYESPRYLATNKVDIEATINILKKISIINGENEFQYSIMSENANRRASRFFTAMCYSKLICVKICASIAVWFCIYFGFYSFLILKKPLFDDIYYSDMTIYLLTIIPIPVFMCLIDTLGRKKTVFFSVLIIGILFIILGILQVCESQLEGIYAEVLARLITSLMSGELYLIFICTSEMYPTYIRCTAMGMCNAIGKLSVFFVILLQLLINSDNSSVNSIPSFVFGVVLLFSAGISILLEETNGKEMDEVTDTYNTPLLKAN